LEKEHNMYDTNSVYIQISLNNVRDNLIGQPYFTEHKGAYQCAVYVSGIGWVSGSADDLRLFAEQLVEAAQAADLFEAESKKEVAA